MTRPEKSLETKLAEIDRRSRKLGAAWGRLATNAVARGELLPGQTPDSPNLNAAQIARHRSAGGRTKTEAEYRAAGLRVLKVRIPVVALARLDEICEESGYSRGEQVQAMIDGDYEEWRAIVPRKAQRGRKSPGGGDGTA